MTDNPDMNLWQIVLGASASFLGGLGLYHNKKISDLSENCIKKSDCSNYRTGTKEDFQRLEDNIKKDFQRLEDNVTQGFNRLSDIIERRHTPRTP